MKSDATEPCAPAGVTSLGGRSHGRRPAPQYEFARQEYYGYQGPVLRVPAWKEGYFNLTGIDAHLTSPTTASATIVEVEGNLAGSNSEATPRKVHGRWVVIDFKVWGVA